MQNDIAKFKTTSKFQYKNSNFAPAKTQNLDLALLRAENRAEPNDVWTLFGLSG